MVTSLLPGARTLAGNAAGGWWLRGAALMLPPLVSPAPPTSHQTQNKNRQRAEEVLEPLRTDVGGPPVVEPNKLGNVILPCDELVQFIKGNFACKVCKKNDATFERFQVGFANKCESINGFITKFSHKNKHWCRSMANSSQTHLAILIDSVGYQQSFESMFDSLGLEMTPRTAEQCLRWDKRRKYLSDCEKQPKAKEKRNRVNFEKLCVGKVKLAKDDAKALTHESGMAGPQVGGKVGGSTARTVCKTCNACGEKGHQKITSKKCLMSTNPNSEHYKKGSLESRRPALEGECVMFS
jgi:hypothetical protein